MRRLLFASVALRLGVKHVLLVQGCLFLPCLHTVQQTQLGWAQGPLPVPPWLLLVGRVSSLALEAQTLDPEHKQDKSLRAAGAQASRTFSSHITITGQTAGPAFTWPSHVNLCSALLPTLQPTVKANSPPEQD